MSKTAAKFDMCTICRCNIYNRDRACTSKTTAKFDMHGHFRGNIQTINGRTCRKRRPFLTCVQKTLKYSQIQMFRSRITGNFDTAKSQGATTARTSADGSSLLSKKWASWTSGGSGGNGKNKTHQSENRKLKRKIGTSREFGEIRRRKRTNQKSGIKRK